MEEHARAAEARLKRHKGGARAPPAATATAGAGRATTTTLDAEALKRADGWGSGGVLGDVAEVVHGADGSGADGADGGADSSAAASKAAAPADDAATRLASVVGGRLVLVARDAALLALEPEAPPAVKATLEAQRRKVAAALAAAAAAPAAVRDAPAPSVADGLAAALKPLTEAAPRVTSALRSPGALGYQLVVNKPRLTLSPDLDRALGAAGPQALAAARAGLQEALSTAFEDEIAAADVGAKPTSPFDLPLQGGGRTGHGSGGSGRKPPRGRRSRHGAAV